MQDEKAGVAYEARLASEKEFYENCAEVHDLPAIFHYWSNAALRPKLEAFGVSGPTEFFEKYMSAQCESYKEFALPKDGRSTPVGPRFVSIGAGNCDLEITLAKSLLGKGYTTFVIDCLEMNPAMIARGQSAAAQAGVSANIAFLETDFNEWKPTHRYDVVIANQSLHHVLNLEGLFEQVRRALTPRGQFVIADMIGRNGHMRWPEALEIIHEFWQEMPEKYRYNRLLKRHEELYENWDCSTEGFEGIRAQDILPLLLKTFHFQLFIGFANLISPFVDRAFGPNFDPNVEWDRDFIDRVHRRDREEMSAGRITPTQMLAVLGTNPSIPTQYLAPLSPEFCVRWPDGQSRRQPFGKAPKEKESPEQTEQRRIAEITASTEALKTKEALKTALWQIDAAANSRWVRLGQRLGLGPKFR